MKPRLTSLRDPDGKARREIEELIRQLGDDDHAVRDEAARRLNEAGYRARDLVERAAASKDAEVRERAKEILKKIGSEWSVIDLGASQEGKR